MGRVLPGLSQGALGHLMLTRGSSTDKPAVGESLSFVLTLLPGRGLQGPHKGCDPTQPWGSVVSPHAGTRVNPVLPDFTVWTTLRTAWGGLAGGKEPPSSLLPSLHGPRGGACGYVMSPAAAPLWGSEQAVPHILAEVLEGSLAPVGVHEEPVQS